MTTTNGISMLTSATRRFKMRSTSSPLPTGNNNYNNDNYNKTLQFIFWSLSSCSCKSRGASLLNGIWPDSQFGNTLTYLARQFPATLSKAQLWLGAYKDKNETARWSLDHRKVTKTTSDLKCSLMANPIFRTTHCYKILYVRDTCLISEMDSRFFLQICSLT